MSDQPAVKKPRRKKTAEANLLEGSTPEELAAGYAFYNNEEPGTPTPLGPAPVKPDHEIPFDLVEAGGHIVKLPEETEPEPDAKPKRKPRKPKAEIGVDPAAPGADQTVELEYDADSVTPEEMSRALQALADKPKPEPTYEDLPDADASRETQDAAPEQAVATDRAAKRSFDEYVERGKEAVALMDTGKWMLCVLAASIGVEYGENSVDEWAAEIGIAGSTAHHYRRMAEFFENATRLAFEAKHRSPDGDCWLKFTHYAQALVLPTPTVAYEWLAIVAKSQWSTDYAAVELKTWMNMRGYEKRNPGKQAKAKTETVYVAKDLSVSPKIVFTKKDGEMWVTIRLQAEPDIVAAFEQAVKKHKNHPLRLTIVQAV